MKSIYKLLIDVGPLAVFFIFYTRSGLQASILPLMIATVIAVLFSSAILAGNEDRAGSAGATDLLVNPWARSSAWGSAGISSVNGL